MKSCLGVLTCNPVTPMKATAEKKKKNTHLKNESSGKLGSTQSSIIFIFEKGLQSF